MVFVATSNFRNSSNLLTKRIENGYGACLNDVCNNLKNLSFKDIAARHFLIKKIGNLSVIKLRIQNSDQKLSSAAGYRLILVCNENHDHVALLEIYPKRGKYSKNDLTKTEYKNILNTYGIELKSGSLSKHDINDSFKLIDEKKIVASNSSLK